MNRRYEPLTAEQLQALRSFADYAGRTWKAQIHDAWLRADMPGIIHGLRNSHGPTWLVNFRFPKKAARNV
jgi:hypothetical protein